MKVLKYVLITVILSFVFYGCASTSVKNKSTVKEEPVVIANDSLEYEIIIIDPGFTTYLNSIARPVGFYSQSYLENKNRFYVTAWNRRVGNPGVFNPNIYENIIDYNIHIDYGYEVNYKLFNYFEFVQGKYRMVLR